MDEILDEIERQRARYGRHMQPPCQESEIAELIHRANRILGVDIPGSYLAFLRRTNGVDWNGAVFFPAATSRYADKPQKELQGIIEANQRLKEVPGNNDFLILGEAGMDMYVLNLKTGKFNIVDHISTDVYESFDSFEGLLAGAYKDRLLPASVTDTPA